MIRVKHGSSMLLGICAQGVRVLSGLIAVSLIIHADGEAGYGLFRWALSLTVIANVVEAGLTLQLKNMMAAAHADSRDHEFTAFARIAATVGYVVGIVGILVVIGCTILPIPIPDTVAPLQNVARGTVIAVAITTFLTLATAFVDIYYDARLLFYAPRIASAVGTIAAIGAMCGAVKLHAPLPIVVFFATGGIAFGRLFLLGRLFRNSRLHVMPSWAGARSQVWPIFARSFPLLGVIISNILLSSLPTLIIANRLGLTEVARYNIAMQLFSVPLMVQAAMLPILWPLFTVDWTQHRQREIKRRLLMLSAITMAVTGAICFGCVVFGAEIVRMWTGKGQLPEIYTLIGIGMFTSFQAIAYWWSTFLHSISDFWYQSISFVVCILVWIIWSTMTVSTLGMNSIAFGLCGFWFVCGTLIIVRSFRLLSTDTRRSLH